MKRKLFTLFLITCLLCQILPVSVFAFTVASAERFSVQILCDNRIDLSGIELMIYEEIGATTEKDGSESVHEDYTFSVFTDSQGSAWFELPEKRFSVNLNLETLPDGYGADTYTKYFGNGEKNGSFTVSKIVSAEIVKSDTGYTLAAYAENGFPLTVDAKVTVTPAVIQAATPKTFTEYSRYNSAAYQVTATYSGKVLTKRVTDDLSGKTAVEKSEYLYNAGLISESEHIRVLCEQLTSEDDWGGEAQCCGTTVMAEITAYAETMSEDDPNYEIIAATAEDTNEPPQYVDGGNVYRQGTNTFFRIHYGTMVTANGTIETAGTLQDAINLNSRLDHIVLFFCTQMGLNMPIGHLDNNVYDIYIVGKSYLDAANGETRPIGTTGSSYMCLEEQVARQATLLTNDTSIGIIAHELSHAIMNAYQLLPGNVAPAANPTDGSWMHESFASFFGSIYTLGRSYTNYSAFKTAYFEDDGIVVSTSNKYVNDRMKDKVDAYLHSIELSLTEVPTAGDYDDRHYGSMLFPLYLFEYAEGIDLIKQILLNYSDSHDPLYAIDTYGLSFEDHYADYCAWVYDLEDNCQIKASGWGSVQDFRDCYSYPSTFASTTANILSCMWGHYSIFPDGNSYVLRVTTTVSGYTSLTNSSVVTRYIDGSGILRVFSTQMTSGQIVSLQRWFGSSVYDCWIAVVNGSIDFPFTYSQTASIS